MRKKKVLFVINTLGCAGAEKALLELLKEFPKEEYEVSLYVLLNQGELISQIPQYVKVLNQNYSNMSVLSKEGKKTLNHQIFCRLFQKGAVFKNISYLLKGLMQMIKSRKVYPDKLLWRVMSDSGMKLKDTYDLAVAYLEGGSTYYVHDHVNAKRKIAFLHVDYTYAGYTRKLDKNCYQDFDRIFTVSEEVRNSLERVYPECKERIMVFPNLIDQKGIREKAKSDGGFSDEYDGWRLLTVGRLTSQKAYEIAIDAMKLLKEKGVQARWYVLGEGELREVLLRQINRLELEKDFILLGAVENPYPYYAQCDLYVHATRFEGKSIAVQEAKILGCPILVSDCNGNREQVKDGVDGSVCALTPESVSTKIEELLENERQRKIYGCRSAEALLMEKPDIKSLFWN
ncbi:glycosyltransferase [Ruminococcus sp. TF08-4]|nr:glycosyltransferase [Ruminococcus sp. TF08-4]